MLLYDGVLVELSKGQGSCNLVHTFPQDKVELLGPINFFERVTIKEVSHLSPVCAGEDEVIGDAVIKNRADLRESVGADKATPVVRNTEIE